MYISCKPTSFARDLEVFLEYGYEPVRAECVDMFPWTRGIETVVCIQRKDLFPKNMPLFELPVKAE